MVKKILLRTFILSLAVLLFQVNTLHALTPEQKRIMQSGIYYFNEEETDFSCSGSGATGSYIPSGAGTELEGHVLPASSGGVGREEKAVLQNGRAVLAPGTSMPGASLNPAPKGATEADARFYINMRWRYVTWSWNGRTAKGPEDGSWYTKAVRKVLVTNPKTGKSVVTSILESGPAPWTGTAAGQAGKNSPPPYWQGYVDGTPPGYDGRVAGLSPEAYAALGDPGMQWGESGKVGYALNYAWADQSVAAGTVTQGNAVISTAESTSPDGSNTTCTSLAEGDFVFYSQHDSAWKNKPFGSSTIDEAGCGPSSLAMVVATLKDRTIKPHDVAEYGTKAKMYVEGEGSSHSLFTLGAQNYGLKSNPIGTDIEAAITGIKNGGLVIASGRGPKPFTTGGHIIVIRGVTDDGKLLVGDPNQSKLDTTEYEQSELMKSVRALWVITK